MIRQPLDVLLHGKPAARLHYEAGDLRLVYRSAYRRAGATPLSLSMPLNQAEHLDDVVRPWLWGLLPDNEDVLKAWSRRFHAPLGSPFDLLASPVGRDCAGAVRFVPSEDPVADLRSGDDVAWQSEHDVAEALRGLISDQSSWLPRDVDGAFSLAGAQAKTALYRHEGRWGVPIGDTPSTHILKPAIRGFADHELNEHLCMDAARRAGLRVARTEVHSFDGVAAIVVERFDRAWVDGSLSRIHQEDMCQALGVDPRNKYQNQGGPSAADVVGLLRRVIPAPHLDAAVDRFVDALIWNWIIVGSDAHAKNYALLLQGDQVRLAPLYDIGSLLPYDHIHPKQWRLAMKYGGSYDVGGYHQNPWPKVATELELDPDRLRARVRELCDLAPDAFREAQVALPPFASTSDMPARLVDAVDARARTVAT